MRLGRRQFVRMGGGLVTALHVQTASAAESAVIDITMGGRNDGSDVWFEPVGILVRPGRTIRWTNRDPGNTHTATAYHPANDGRPLRIPRAAMPWDSGYLLPGESFSVILTSEGVYDYFCFPHEKAGMVGRIIVGDPGVDGNDTASADAGLPGSLLAAFPTVPEIMAAPDGRVVALESRTMR